MSVRCFTGGGSYFVARMFGEGAGEAYPWDCWTWVASLDCAVVVVDASAVVVIVPWAGALCCCGGARGGGGGEEGEEGEDVVVFPGGCRRSCGG